MSPRRIVVITPNYRPESNAGANRVTSLAEHLADSGAEVLVITLQPHHPQNRIYEGYDLPSGAAEVVNGVEVIRIRPWLAPKDSLPRRMLSELRFTFQALLRLWRTPADVIVASSPYMFLGPSGLLAARLRRTRFVWDVRDLTWLYPRAAGKRTFGLDRLIDRLMRFTAARADALTTATEGLFDYFHDKPRIAACIPNGVNDDWLDRLASLPARDPLGPKLVVYAGLFGYNHGVATIVEAAALVPEAQFLLVGDGPEREALAALVAEKRLDNVTFGGYRDQAGLLEVYRRADVLVSHVRRNPIFLWTQPAKLWEYMASGRPVVHAGEGEVTPIVEGNGLGLVVPPEQPALLAARIKDLLDDESLARDLAVNARAFVGEHRRRSRLNARYADLIERVLEDPA